MYCKTCGNELQPGNAFCGQCGTPAPKQPTQDSGVKFGDFSGPASQTPLYPSDAHYDSSAGQQNQWQSGPQTPKQSRWKLPVIIGLCCVLPVLLVVGTVLVVDFLSSDPTDVPIEPDGPISTLKPHIPVSPQKPDAPEVPAEPEKPEGPLVTDAFFDDSHLTSYNSGIFAIPQINLDSDEVRDINEEIYRELYTNLVKGLLENWDNRQNGGEYVLYSYYEVGDTLSLVIEVHPVDWAWTDYYVYNVSISEGRKLSDDEVIAQSGVVDFRRTAKQALETYFWESYPVRDEFAGDFYNEQLDKTRAQSNINEAVPYLNDDGELCVIAPIYSLAGAAYYLHEVNLEDFDYDERYAGYPEAAVSDDDYMIPDSDSRRISESELYGLSEHECWLALNEIYARHGRLFARQEFADYFNSKPWYNGYIDGSVFDANADSYLNSTEQANLATIIEYQKKMGWR